MSVRLLWIGLTLFCIGDTVATNSPYVKGAGTIIMIVGCVLLLVDKK